MIQSKCSQLRDSIFNNGSNSRLHTWDAYEFTCRLGSLFFTEFLISLLTLSLLLFLLCHVSFAGAGNIQHNEKNTPIKILVLHSYEKNHVCGQPQHDGVISGIEAAGFTMGTDFQIQAVFMDTKQKNNTPKLIKEQTTHALAIIEQSAPQILVTLDDNAFQNIALQLVDTPISIVFSGLNGQPEMYHGQTPFLHSRQRPGHNITGVYEKLHIVDALI